VGGAKPSRDIGSDPGGGRAGVFERLHRHAHPSERGVPDLGVGAEVFAQQRAQVLPVDEDEEPAFGPISTMPSLTNLCGESSSIIS
jgi:hypothetical protein